MTAVPLTPSFRYGLGHAYRGVSLETRPHAFGNGLVIVSAVNGYPILKAPEVGVFNPTSASRTAKTSTPGTNKLRHCQTFIKQKKLRNRLRSFCDEIGTDSCNNSAGLYCAEWEPNRCL